jgi:hypothetical protein
VTNDAASLTRKSTTEAISFGSPGQLAHWALAMPALSFQQRLLRTEAE